MTYTDNRLDPKLDIIGTLEHQQNLELIDEFNMYGAPIQSGTGAVTSGNDITGLSGIVTNSNSNYIELTGLNSGIYKIISVISSSHVTVEEILVADSGISWIERYPYSIQDDINYIRSDRANIKGVNYYNSIPEYYRCSDQLTAIPANLSNIAGKTTDAKSVIVDKKIEDVNIVAGYNFTTITSLGNLKHSTSVDRTGIPIYDGYDSGNNESTYAEIISNGEQQGLYVIDGYYKGNRIFGRMRSGLSTSPNSVEIEWRSVGPDKPISESVSYVWENAQITTVDIYYPYRNCLFNIDENAFRTVLINGLISKKSGVSLPEAQAVGQVLFSINGQEFTQAMPITTNQGWLVNEYGLLLVGV